MLTPTDLLGAWTLHRRVVDRRADRHGRLVGTLTLSQDGDAVRWDEAGLFTFDGHQHEASRTLFVRPEGDGWTVYFADGHEFHPWRPGATVTHVCRADVYRGVLDARPDRLRVLWDVTGPAKSQRLVSRCVRMPSAAAGPAPR